MATVPGIVASRPPLPVGFDMACSLSDCILLRMINSVPSVKLRFQCLALLVLGVVDNIGNASLWSELEILRCVQREAIFGNGLRKYSSSL